MLEKKFFEKANTKEQGFLCVGREVGVGDSIGHVRNENPTIQVVLSKKQLEIEICRPKESSGWKRSPESHCAFIQQEFIEHLTCRTTSHLGLLRAVPV